MNIARRTLAASTLIAATALALGACGSSKPQATDTSPAADPTPPAATQSATASSVPTVPGYRPGEIPPIPLFAVPSIDVFASNADKAIIDSASKSLNTVPGVTISPAKCDGTSLVSGSTVLGGDSSAVSSSDKGTVVNGATVKEAPKVEKVDKLGKFPPVESLKPVESCGTVIPLEDGVLFDFGKSDIRADAAQTLGKLATVLTNAKVPAAHVYGHTDSVSDEAFNQQLSEARANAVKDELSKKGVGATMDATGYGESKPVAPNENADGSDNPAGRALNRRVEIFIPAF